MRTRRSNYDFCVRPDALAPKLGHFVLSGPRIGLTAKTRIVDPTVRETYDGETLMVVGGLRWRKKGHMQRDVLCVFDGFAWLN